MQIIRKPCAPANFRSGRHGHKVEAIIIHVIDGSQASCDATFASNSLELKRSAHYSIGRSGVIHQYVDEHDTAFHAGRIQQPTWPGMKQLAGGDFINPNLYTIGIEHEGRANDEWLDVMYDTTAQLMREIAARHPSIGAFTTTNVGLHRQIFSGKSCPGTKFQLSTLLGKFTQVAPQPSALDNGPTAAPDIVTVQTPVRVRQRTPSTSAPIHSVLPSGHEFTPVALVTGEMVSGNARWYELVNSLFIWAGATDQP